MYRFSERLKQLRKDKQLTQKELWGLTGQSQSGISA